MTRHGGFHELRLGDWRVMRIHYFVIHICECVSLVCTESTEATNKSAMYGIIIDSFLTRARIEGVSYHHTSYVPMYHTSTLTIQEKREDKGYVMICLLLLRCYRASEPNQNLGFYFYAKVIPYN